MPQFFCEWGRSWLDLNPGWEMTTWTEANLPPSAHPEAVRHACHLSQLSNIYRYEILAKHGGVYIDTDFQALRPLGSLLDGVSAFVARKGSALGGRIKAAPACAVIGCEPGHPFAVELAARIPERDPARSLSLGSGYLREVLAGHPEVEVMAPGTFYPLMHFEWRKAWPNGRLSSPDALRAMFPGAVALHHWSSRWYAPGFAPLRQGTLPP